MSDVLEKIKIKKGNPLITEDTTLEEIKSGCLMESEGNEIERESELGVSSSPISTSTTVTPSATAATARTSLFALPSPVLSPFSQVPPVSLTNNSSDFVSSPALSPVPSPVPSPVSPSLTNNSSTLWDASDSKKVAAYLHDLTQALEDISTIQARKETPTPYGGS